VSVTADCFRGHLATFQIALLTAAGARDTLEFTAPVGTAAANQPLGPDAHGYYAFDTTDTAYPYHPTYSWIEIDPALGGSGTAIPLTDYGWEQDDTEILALPFAFTYYGETFDKISVCSNGWLAMGATSLRNYRNWTLPCAGSPDAMICASGTTCTWVRASAACSGGTTRPTTAWSSSGAACATTAAAATRPSRSSSTTRPTTTPTPATGSSRSVQRRVAGRLGLTATPRRACRT
jgi:hypothetical protein